MDGIEFHNFQTALAGPHFAVPHGPGSGTQVTLRICAGKARQMVREVEGPVYMIGGALDCDLVLGDRRFPEVHSYLFVRPEGVAIQYLGEGPPVTVDGRAFIRGELADGDVIITGNYQFRIQIDMPARIDGDPAEDLWDDEDERAAIWSQASPRAEARREVRNLLEDVRAALPPAPGRLRLYREPDDTTPIAEEPERRQPSRRGHSQAAPSSRASA